MRKAALPLIIGILCAASVAQLPSLAKRRPYAHDAVSPPIASVRVLPVAEAEHRSTPLLPVVDQPDIEPADRIFLDHLLRVLPPLCRDNLEQLIGRYDPSVEERGESTAEVIMFRGPLSTLEGAKRMEMIAVLVHECGHPISLGALNGVPEAGVSPYPDAHVPTYNGPAARFYAISWENATTRKPGMEDEDFVSGYAMEDPFEDFAETFAAYALHEKSFRALVEENPVLREKHLFMRHEIFGEEYASPPSPPLALGAGKVWDITKLPHGLVVP